MNRDELLNESLHVANRLMADGATMDALTVLTLLAEDAGFGDSRMIACVNCGIVAGNLGRWDDALAWYDRGIALEAARPTRIAARNKARLLSEIDRVPEALALYLELLSAPISTDEADAIRAAVAELDKGPPA